MSRLRFLSVALAFGLLFLGGTNPGVTSAPRPEDPKSTNTSIRAPTPPDSAAVAVVELFTSEGCSSCPPADRLLRSLVEKARTEGRPIYALSFHVDYWNQLGWKDPYSDAAFSQRQRRYSQKIGVDTYTPQIVVNGQRAMVGSRAGQVQGAIESALAEPARVEVDLQVEETETLSVTYRLNGDPPPDARLRLALVERGLSQNVTRGENAGRTLRHANVVRNFTTVPAQPNGTTQLSLPNAVDRSKASIIGYVQAPSWAVLGATRVDLRTEKAASAR